MDQVQYYGMGPMESYCDKHRAASHGIFGGYIEDLHEDYIRPQENGSHYDCSYVTIENDTYKFEAFGEKTFCFNISAYTRTDCKET